MKNKIAMLVLASSLIAVPINIYAYGNQTYPQDKMKEDLCVFRGKITSLVSAVDEDGNETLIEKTILVKNQFDQVLEFLITYKTSIVKEDLNEGEDVVIVYDCKHNMYNSDSQKYLAKVITDDIKGCNVIVDKFDNEYLNSYGKTKLETNEDTIVLSNYNENYNGDIENKDSIVFYNNSGENLESYEIMGKKIIVLDSQLSKPIDQVLDKSKINDTIGVSDFYLETLTEEQRIKLEIAANMSDLIVNFVPIINGEVFKTYNGDRMVPIKLVLEQLGYDFRFCKESGMMSVNEKYYMLLGDSSCTIDGEIIILDAPPILQEDEVYVSLDFFSKILNKCAYELKGNVLIYDL